MKTIKIFPFLILVSLCITSLKAQKQEEPVTARVEGHVFKPVKLEPTEARIKQLKVPAGFKVEKFAENLGSPRMIAVSEKGDVFVTIREEGKVIRLQDSDGDGKADKQKTIAEIDKVHGININDNKMYLATVYEIFVADLYPDGTISEPQIVVDDLPDGGQHANRTLAFGPDNKLYLSIGSTCNACEETNEEHATIVQMNADGSDRKVFSSGLRNTMGFGWHPKTMEMWGMDHGMDWLGDDEQKEELNRLEEGAGYGWPYIYGKGKFNPGDQPDDMSYEEYAAKSKEPVLLYPEAHSAALGMIFYNGEQFPEEYQNDSFIAMHGSWNRKDPVGYKVVRLRFTDDGQAEGFEDFLTGFLTKDKKGRFGRPVALAVHTDGSLLVTDDDGGVVYRISYAR